MQHNEGVPSEETLRRRRLRPDEAKSAWASGVESRKHEEEPDSTALLEKEPAEFRCADCQEARSSMEYKSRVLKLFEPLYCFDCKRTHASLFFSHSQRHSPALGGQRKCIAHEGRLQICEHMSFTWAELVDTDWATSPLAKWKEKYREYIIVCQHPSHHAETACDEEITEEVTCSYASISIRKVGDVARLSARNIPAVSDQILPVVAQVELGPSPARFRQGETYDLETALLSVNDNFSPPKSAACTFCNFCPHLVTSPERVRALEQFRHIAALLVPRGVYVYRCHLCDFEIRLLCPINPHSLPEPSWHRAVRYQASLLLDLQEPTNISWLSHLDPNSYGMLSDPDTKHITWCDSRHCATTYNLQGTQAFHGILDVQPEELETLRAECSLTEIVELVDWMMTC